MAVENKKQVKRIDPYFEIALFFQHHAPPADLELAIQGAAAIDPADPRLDYFRGVAKFLENTDLPGAERLLAHYASSAPQRNDWPFRADALECLGGTLASEGKRAAAIAQYRKAP